MNWPLTMAVSAMVVLVIFLVCTMLEAVRSLRRLSVAAEAQAEALGTLADAKFAQVELAASQVVDSLPPRQGGSLPPVLTADCVQCGLPSSLCRCNLATVLRHTASRTPPPEK